MKLINMIIYEMFKAELNKVKELIEGDVKTQREYYQRQFEYANQEQFYVLKEKIKKLHQFTSKLNSEDILDIDFNSPDSPVFILAYKKKIEEIFENVMVDKVCLQEVTSSIDEGERQSKIVIDDEQSAEKFIEMLIDFKTRIKKLETGRD